MSFEIEKNLDQTYMMPTFGRSDVEFVSGNGMEIAAADGRTYLDFLAGIGVCCLGHAHPAVTAALTRQVGKLLHVSNYFYIEHRGEAAALLSKLANDDMTGAAALADALAARAMGMDANQQRPLADRAGDALQPDLGPGQSQHRQLHRHNLNPGRHTRQPLPERTPPGIHHHRLARLAQGVQHRLHLPRARSIAAPCMGCMPAHRYAPTAAAHGPAPRRRCVRAGPPPFRSEARIPLPGRAVHRGRRRRNRHRPGCTGGRAGPIRRPSWPTPCWRRARR